MIFITVNSCVSYAFFSTIRSNHSGCKVTNEKRFTLIFTVDFCITEELNRHLISSMNGIDIHLYNCSFLVINKHTSSLNTNIHESEFYSLFLLWKKKQLFASVSRLRNLPIVYVLIWTFSGEAWIYLVSYFTVYSCAGKFNNFDVWLRTLLISSHISLYFSCLNKDTV